MRVTRLGTATTAGPTRWFTGAVYVDTIATPWGTSRVAASKVHFTPGARTAWHTHACGQTIFVTDGLGLVQRRGAPIEVVRAGDRVFFEPGEDHWHGAAPNTFMTHVAIWQVDVDGKNAMAGQPVSEAEYAAAPPIDGL